jgi:trimeric autotransporter adhesin
MRNLFACLVSLFLLLFFAGQSSAQQSQVTPAASGTAASSVPRLVKFSGTLLDRQGQPLKGPVGVTFSLYAQQSGDAPLWMETQNVELDAKGNYTVLLGANSATNLPEEFFRNGEARWLGVQPEHEPELPRVLLVSVPYALKAGDATTLGGLPASAFALAGSNPSSSGQPSLILPFAAGAQSPAPLAPGTLDVTTAGGSTNKLAKFDTSTDITPSLIFDNGTNVSIGNTSPAAKLDVSGSGIFRGTLQLPSTATANITTKGFNSQPLDLLASVFNGTAAVGQQFRWQAEPVNPGLSTASGKLNLLFASGTGSPAETGLSINNKGILSFATGQPLPTVTGNETVTGNLSANQLQSNVATGTAPLVVKSTTQVPNLNASLLGGMPASAFATRGANSFSGFQSIAGNGLSMYIGDVACPAGTVGIQAQVFSFGCSNFAMMLDTSGNEVINRPSGGTISFREGNSTDQVILAAGGKVGVGISFPASQLEVHAGLSTSDAISAYGNFTGRGVLARGGTNPAGSGGDGVSAYGGSAGAAGSGAGNGITAVGGAAARLSSDLGGFGILAIGGLNGDGSQQQRAGEFRGDVEVTGCLSVSPNTTAHVQFGSCLSDVRLKKNIEAFPAVLDKFVQLRPVTYDWRTEEYPQFRFSSGKEIGLIAQEVEKVFPDMVSTDQLGYKRVNYGELPYLMLQAIRELKAEKDELQQEIKTKEAQWEERFRAQEERAGLQDIQQQMAALEARLAQLESRGGTNQSTSTTREISKGNEGVGQLEVQAKF